MHLKNQRGFSFLEIMVTVGILGGVALVTMRLFEDQTNNEALIRSKGEIQKMIGVVRTTLRSGNNCRYNFNTYSIGQLYANWRSGGVPVQDLKLFFQQTPTTLGEKILLSANKDYNEFSTDGFSVNYTSPSGGSAFRLDLRFKYKKKSTDGKVSGNWAYVTEKIYFNATTDSSGRISDCGEVISAANATAQQKFCLSLEAAGAATWNSTTSKCTFSNNMTCPLGQVVVGLNKLGGVQCGAIRDHIKLDSLFDVSTCRNVSGKYRIIYNGNGKLKVDCVP
jgi:prepilin-type N-terminal cleavage/methylation domain-containing protein